MNFRETDWEGEWNCVTIIHKDISDVSPSSSANSVLVGLNPSQPSQTFQHFLRTWRQCPSFECTTQEPQFRVSVVNKKDEDPWEDPSDVGMMMMMMVAMTTFQIRIKFFH